MKACQVALAAMLAVAPAAAQKVVVVLSSDLRPYEAAYESFKASFGDAPVLYAGDEGMTLPKETKLVVAFGGKAATQSYPSRVALVYGLAPGLVVTSDTHDGVNVYIRMVPDLPLLLGRLRDLQPRLRRLGVLWSGNGFKPQIDALSQAGRKAGVEIVPARVDGPEALPQALRGLGGRVDALWLLPDPLLVNQETFGIIRDYSYGNGIPFYAPTEGLVEQGATACVAPDFQDVGRAAAEIARKIGAGQEVAEDYYTESAETTVNLAAAKKAGLSIPASALGRSAKVLP